MFLSVYKGYLHDIIRNHFYLYFLEIHFFPVSQVKYNIYITIIIIIIIIFGYMASIIMDIVISYFFEPGALTTLFHLTL